MRQSPWIKVSTVCSRRSRSKASGSSRSDIRSAKPSVGVAASERNDLMNLILICAHFRTVWHAIDLEATIGIIRWTEMHCSCAVWKFESCNCAGNERMLILSLEIGEITEMEVSTYD
jgi:hypothetical protein